MLGPGNMQLSALTLLVSSEAFTTTESHLIIDRVRRYQHNNRHFNIRYDDLDLDTHIMKADQRILCLMIDIYNF